MVGFNPTVVLPQNFQPNWNPTCKLWLTADRGITISTGVSNWNDQSSSGLVFSQNTGSRQPTFNTSDSNFNNKPSLSFLGSSNQILISTGALVVAQPHTTILVAYPTLNNVQLCGSNVTGYGGFVAQTNAWLFYAGGFLSSGAIATQTPTVVAAIANSTTSIYVNNSQTAVNSGSAGTNGLSSNYDVSGGDLSNYLTGSITEHIIFSGALTPTQLKEVFVYLGTKYHITTS